MGAHIRSFRESTERFELPGLISELVSLGTLGVAHNIHAVGWRWSTDVRPTVGTTWCEVRHVGYAIQGQLELTFPDGTSAAVSAGDVFDVAAMHDGRVIGAKPFESIEWFGARTWLADLATRRERVLATIVMADIVTSTRIAASLGEQAWADKLASYEQSMADIIDSFGGRVVKYTGDGVLVVFDGTVKALRAAVAMRDTSREMELPTRTSVHTGEIETASDDVHGLAVHETARMLDIASSNEIVVSATTRLFGEGQGINLRPRGMHQLRGIEGPRELYAIEM